MRDGSRGWRRTTEAIEKQVDLMLMVVEVKILLVGVSFFFFSHNTTIAALQPHILLESVRLGSVGEK